jgi:hypothetical protein
VCSRLRLGIDADALHRGKVDDQAVVDQGKAGTVVTASSYGDEKIIVPSKMHCGYNIRYVRAASDEERPLVDHAVIDLARLVILGVTGLNQLAAQAALKAIDHCFVKVGGFTRSVSYGRHVFLLLRIRVEA